MLNFKELVNMEVGTVFFETGYGMSLKYELVEKPLVTTIDMEGNPRSQVSLTGRGGVYDLTQDFLVTEGLEHYGPKLYLQEAVYTSS